MCAILLWLLLAGGSVVAQQNDAVSSRPVNVCTFLSIFFFSSLECCFFTFCRWQFVVVIFCWFFEVVEARETLRKECLTKVSLGKCLQSLTNFHFWIVCKLDVFLCFQSFNIIRNCNLFKRYVFSVNKRVKFIYTFEELILVARSHWQNIILYHGDITLFAKARKSAHQLYSKAMKRGTFFIHLSDTIAIVSFLTLRSIIFTRNSEFFFFFFTSFALSVQNIILLAIRS